MRIGRLERGSGVVVELVSVSLDGVAYRILKLI